MHITSVQIPTVSFDPMLWKVNHTVLPRRRVFSDCQRDGGRGWKTCDEDDASVKAKTILADLHVKAR